MESEEQQQADHPLTEDTRRALSSHTCDTQAVEAMREVRAAAREFAKVIEAVVPDMGEQDIALYHVRMAMMMANAGISYSHPIDKLEV